jgi:hypothetical protein
MAAGNTMASAAVSETRTERTQASALRRALSPAVEWAVEDRARLSKIAVAAGCACGFVLSRRLWLSSVRDYPHAPVADFLRPPAFPLDFAWVGALFVLLALVAVSARPRKYLAAFLVAAGLLALWDQSRWQPWFYQYYFMLAALALFPWGGGGERIDERRAAALDACRLVVAGTYFWGGVQKLNPGFEGTMLLVLGRQLPQTLAATLAAAATFVVPAVEILVGVALLTRRFRNAAVVLALATHAVVLLMLVPSGTNTVVWPWNVAMAAAVVILFWRARDFSARRVLSHLRRPFNLAVAVLFCVMPALGLVGLWDSYLSAALYTGGTKEAIIRFGEPVYAGLPARARRAVTREGEGYILSVRRWSFAELNVPAYPEERIFRRVARDVCERADTPGDVTLEIHQRPRRWGEAGRTKTLDCASLVRCFNFAPSRENF